MNDRKRLVEILESAESAFYWNSSDKTFVEKIADYLIANGVTIQKHGRWEEYVNIKGVVRCSECNDTYIYREWVDEGKWYYCPNCGANMDEEAIT
jgi:formylmethanofuran dehydrogenase subunit E